MSEAADSVVPTTVDQASGPSGNPDRGVMVSADLGEQTEGSPQFACLTLRLPDEETVEQLLAPTRSGTQARPDEDSSSAMRDCMRMVVAVCLMADDPELVLADVLSKDRLDYERTGDQKYVERGRRRGKVGWLVGAHVEVDPHYRRPHFGIHWTGRGRSVPRVVPVHGCVVHRSKVTQAPTGRMDTEAQGNA